MFRRRWGAHLSALVCDQGGQRLGVEAAVAEAQAAVHAVGGQLQGLLPDVVLEETERERGFNVAAASCSTSLHVM